MKLKLTKEMIELATHHQNRNYYFEKFEKLVRTTYPEWKDVSKNEIYKKFDLVYSRNKKIKELISDRNIYVNLMREQVDINLFNIKLSKYKSEKNYNYWFDKIKEIDKQLIKNGYKPNNIPSFTSLLFFNNIKNIILISSIIGFVIAILFIIF